MQAPSSESHSALLAQELHMPGLLCGNSLRYVRANLPVLVFHCTDDELAKARITTQAELPGLEKISIQGSAVHLIHRKNGAEHRWIFRKPEYFSTIDTLVYQAGVWSGSVEAMEDLALGRIRLAPGVPLDACHAIRLAAEAALLDFQIEEELLGAAKQAIASREEEPTDEFLGRVFRDVVSGAKPSTGFVALRDMGALSLMVPELAEGQNLSQNQYHEFDIFFHSIFACDALKEQNLALRLAALLHDVGKSKTRRVGSDGQATFHNHEVVGARQTDRLLRRLGFESDLIARVRFLVRHHMFHYTPDWTDHAVRRFMRKVNVDQMRDLIAVRIADRKGSGKRAGVPRPVYDFLAHMERIRAEDAQLKVTDLTLGGNELMEMGIPAGRGMGDVLKRLLEEVKSGALVNEKEALSARVREYGGVH
ncbi:MAG TPA: HDIG domain-containing protein [Leptospiraceae bacterium]|nr:HDIG domain-containing protein [Leptospirales bacterium]HMX56097.1 HDIG domain-containing protein [Leptospiraceae bacterium]HMY43897.1 HDIG domain-containing protein [Leptospiraceae bacterium]HMZ35301.1 HDIG domain-containing protein [Leptospiraceae bacterium]HNJ04419.1 HDIG domain-containing protein [Leptospiraceae bacterium]